MEYRRESVGIQYASLSQGLYFPVPETKVYVVPDPNGDILREGDYLLV